MKEGSISLTGFYLTTVEFTLLIEVADETNRWRLYAYSFCARLKWPTFKGPIVLTTERRV